MFTGIVEKAVPVAAVEDHAGGRRITLGVRWGDERHGESVAVNGCCLTVAAMDDQSLSFDAIRETLDKTNLGSLRVGDRVHVERSLRPGDRIDGHFVQGHVDGPAELVGKTENDTEWRMRLRVRDDLAAFVMPKGSVCLDGVSLTVAALDARDGREFEVAIIPTTLEKTGFAQRAVGWRFNFEADILAKSVVTTLRRMGFAAESGQLPAAASASMMGARKQ